MANALFIPEATESQTGSKTTVLQTGINAVADALTKENPIDLSGGSHTLTDNDIYRFGVLVFAGVSGGVATVDWPTGRARQILAYADAANTHDVDITHGTTTFQLVPGAGYWLISNGAANDLVVLHLNTLGAGAGYVSQAGDTMTGNLLMQKAAAADDRYIEWNTAGSARARLGQFGDENFTLAISTDGAVFKNMIVAHEDGSKVVVTVGTGVTYTFGIAGDIIFSNANSSTFQLTVRSQSASGFVGERYETGSGGPTNRFNKYRGPISAPTIVVTNDVAGQFTFFGYDGAALRQGGQMVWTITDTAPGAGAMGMRARIDLAAIGTISVTEVARWDHAAGWSAFGANPVLNPDRGLVLRSTTIAGVASLAKTTGTQYFISDYRGGVIAVYDGTDMVLPGVKELMVALSDETTPIVTGTGKLKIRAPCQMKLSSSIGLPRASVGTAAATGTITVDINEGDTPVSILGTKLTIDATEKTSTTGAACTITDGTIANDAEISFDLDDDADGTATGLKVTIYYKEVVA
jgi:hypothetical protein